MKKMQYRAEGGPVEGEGEYEHDGKPEFNMPDGLDIPAGETKEVSCMIRSLGNGMACVESVNGIPLAAPEKEEVPESMQDMEGDEGTENNFSKFMSGRNSMTNKG